MLDTGDGERRLLQGTQDKTIDLNNADEIDVEIIDRYLKTSGSLNFELISPASDMVG